MLSKVETHRAWIFVIPVVLLVAFNALVPLMTVVNYSVQETFGNNLFFWHGMGWFEDVLRSERFHAALGRQLLFTFTILFIEVPLGVIIALAMPRKGLWVPVCLVLMALPLLIPWNVVGSMWNIFTLPDIGMMGYTINSMGIDYNMTQQPFAAWATIVLMDVWHWTSLVVLLTYAGLISIPSAYYQAAAIDGARPWAVFRHIQLPKLRRVLTIAILLRFMDSFMIYTEPFVHDRRWSRQLHDVPVDRPGQDRAGPVRPRAGGRHVADLFPGHAAVVSWIFYTVMTRHDASSDGAMNPRAQVAHRHVYIVFLMLPIYWLLSMSFKTTNEIPGVVSPCGRRQFTLENYATILDRPLLVLGLHQLVASIRHHEHRAVGRGGAAGGLRLLPVYLHGRQAPVLLVPDQPHGAAGRLCLAVFPALFGGRACSTRTLPWRSPTASSTFRWPCGSSKVSCRRCPRNSTKPPMSTAIRSRVSSSASSCPTSRPASASPRSSVSCSRGSRCCWPRR